MTMKVEKSNGATLEVTVEGRLRRADYETFVPEVEAMLEAKDKVNLLIDVTRLDGWTASALWEDVKFDLKHFDDVAKVAVVGEPPSSHWLAALARPFTTAEVRHFRLDDIDAARAWLH